MVDVLVTFGSGGHSSEMLMLIQNARISDKLNSGVIRKLVCLISEDDTLAPDKIRQLFNGNSSSSITDSRCLDGLEIVSVKRARKIGQSYMGAVFTTMLSLFNFLGLVYRFKPHICLTNGPAISVTICVAICVLQTLRLLPSRRRSQVIFVESFCRTQTLSMSAKIIYHLRLASAFLVQWPHLSKLYPRAQFRGVLV